MLKKNVVAFAVGFAAISGASLAGPVGAPPTWGLNDGYSVSMYWSFDGPLPYTPDATVAWDHWAGVRMTAEDLVGDPGKVGERTGVQGITRKASPGGETKGRLAIDIGNKPGEKKDFWFQYDRYYEGPGAQIIQFDWTLPPGTVRTPVVFDLPEVDLGKGWKRVTGHLSFTPQPESEIMGINFAVSSLGGTVAIDNLYIHTHCIPAPASVGLFGLALTAARRRRTQ